MKKIIILLTLATLLLACQGTPQRETFEFDKFVGTEGVVFGFLDRAPPDEVYEGSTFPVYVEFEHKGLFWDVETSTGRPGGSQVAP